MTWTLGLAGPVSDVYASLEEKVKRAKENRPANEQQDIDAAVELFKKLVKNDPRLACNFWATGHHLASIDVSFNTTCSVDLK